MQPVLNVHQNHVVIEHVQPSDDEDEEGGKDAAPRQDVNFYFILNR